MRTKAILLRRLWYRLTAVVVIALLLWPNAGIARADDSLIDQLQQANQQNVEIRLHDETGVVSSLRIPDATFNEPDLYRLSNVNDQGVVAYSFVRTYGSIFGLNNLGDGTDSIKEIQRQTIQSGSTYVKYQQYYKDIPVVAGEIVVGMTSQRRIRNVNAEILPMANENINIKPNITKQQAQSIARQLLQRNLGNTLHELTVSDEGLWIFNPKLLGGPQVPITTLNWRMEVTGYSVRGPVREFVLVNAHTGNVTMHFSKVTHALNQRICDNKSVADKDKSSRNNCLSDKKAARTNSLVDTGNADVDIAWEFTKATYDYYKFVLNRDSIDNRGMRLVSVVNYCLPDEPEWDFVGCPYPNAFWDGSQMTYGEGFANADDVVAHELTHGVTQYTANLFYYYQSGAINEALSDIMGEIIDRAHNGRSEDDGDEAWLLGEDLPIGAIRNMQDPTTNEHPDKMSSTFYFSESWDNGGVHYNSGVANKAAYLLMSGDTFNGQTVSSIGDEKTARLFYGAMTQHLTSGSDYANLADALVSVCDAYAQDGLHSFTSGDCAEVEKVILATEMRDSPTNAPAVDAQRCVDGMQPLVSFEDQFSNPKLSLWKTSPAKTWFNGSWYSVDGTRTMLGSTPLYSKKGVDAIAQLKSPVLIPEQAYMHFEHAYFFDNSYVYDPDTEELTGPYYWDGGVIEYSSDGKTWTDAGSLISVNGYTNTIAETLSNPLSGREAFAGESRGYISSRLDLSSLAGQRLFFRFRIGTDTFIGSDWFIDNLAVYTCVNEDTHVVDLSGGGEHTCATTIGGDVLCWGKGSAGQIGNGASSDAVKATFAVDVSDARVESTYPVGTGGEFTCALQADKSVACWGANESGQLGNNTLVASEKAVTVLVDDVTPLTNVVSVATGRQHACAVRADSTAYCWGSNNYGQLGNVTETEQYVAVAVQKSGGAILTNVTQVVAGANHSCALLRDTSVWCWGDNLYGQLGVGSTLINDIGVAVEAKASAKKPLKGVRSLAAGADSTCALTTKGAVLCWGSNEMGQIGNGTYNYSVLFPTAPKIGKKALTNVAQISMGLGNHVCAIDTRKNIYCWGANDNGQLGLNSTVSMAAPTMMNATVKSTIGTVVKITTGVNHTCALNTQMAVYCWGDNTDGQLGEGGGVASSLLPVQVIDVNDVVLGLP